MTLDDLCTNKGITRKIYNHPCPEAVFNPWLGVYVEKDEVFRKRILDEITQNKGIKK